MIIRLSVSVLLISVLLTESVKCLSDNLYEVLGLSQGATSQSIRKAYKSLVKEYHPDKNSDPDAAQKFMEVQHAYEILSDPAKRRQYDQYGTINEHEHSAEQKYRNGFRDFDRFFHQFAGAGRENFYFHMPNHQGFYTKHKITYRLFEEGVLPQSQKKPFLIFVYATWCFSCMKAEPIWETVVNDLEPIGCGVGTVNNAYEFQLVERLHVTQLPAIVLVFDGRVLHYKQSHIDRKSLIEFVRNSVPSNLVQHIDDQNFDSFVDKAHVRNQVAVLIFSSKSESPRLRFVLMAAAYRSYASFAFVSPTVDAHILRSKFGLLKSNNEALIILLEQKWKPVATLQMDEISADLMRDTIERYKYLFLPRLSSQLHFDELCPISSSHEIKICAILVISSDQEPSDRLCISTFRNYAQSRNRKVQSGPSVKFTYVYKDKQPGFVSSLETAIEENGETHTILQGLGLDQNSGSSNEARPLFLIRRLTSERARVRLIQHAWDASNDDRLNASVEIFERELRRWKASKNDQASFDAHLHKLIDENGPGLYKKLASKLVRSVEAAWFQITRHEAMPILSVFGTLMAIMGIGWCLNYAVESERNAEKQAEAKQDRGKPVDQKLEFKRLIREMRGETYFGMVRLLKPGFRSLVVLCDENSKSSLVNQFAKAIWPWRKNHSLLFGFVLVEKNLDWYRQILRSAVLTEGDQQSTFGLEKINPKNVIGTVLAMNGFRQYFCIYHPKYAPSLEGYGHKNSRKQNKNGNFLGFDDVETFSLSDDGNDSDSEREAEQIRRKILNKKCLKLDELLDGLPNWLDRLFEGSVRRYYVQQWPKEMH